MKETKFIIGEKIDLCVLNIKLHLNNCWVWINDPEINKWLLIGIFPTYLFQEEEWFKGLGNKENIVFAIVTKEEKHIGNVGLHKIDYLSKTAELGIIIGKKQEWGKGVATEAEKLMIDYGFNSLNLQKIYASIFADNIGSQKAAQKNGARLEGTLKKHVYKNGKYNDLTCMAFFKE